MTTGQIMFLCGAALLAVTVILAVVFLVKKPRYQPDGAYSGQGTEGTQHLRSGKPTARLTPQTAGKPDARSETANTGTVPLREAASAGTAPLQGSASAGTMPLQEPASAGTMPLQESASAGTVPLQEAATAGTEATVPLGKALGEQDTAPLPRSDAPAAPESTAPGADRP